MPDFMQDYGHFPRVRISVESVNGCNVGDAVGGMKSGGMGMVMGIEGTVVEVQSMKAQEFVSDETLVWPNGFSVIRRVECLSRK